MHIGIIAIYYHDGQGRTVKIRLPDESHVGRYVGNGWRYVSSEPLIIKRKNNKR